MASALSQKSCTHCLLHSGANNFLSQVRWIKIPDLPASPGTSPAEGPLSLCDGAESLHLQPFWRALSYFCPLHLEKTMEKMNLETLHDNTPLLYPHLSQNLWHKILCIMAPFILPGNAMPGVCTPCLLWDFVSSLSCECKSWTEVRQPRLTSQKHSS